MIFKHFLIVIITMTGLCIGITHANAQVPGGKKPETPAPLINNDSGEIIKSPSQKIIQKKSDRFNVALLLPFNVMQSMDVDTSGEIHYDFTPETSLAIQYYHGALLALDSLKKTGIKLNVFVLDGGTDSNTLRKIFNSGIIDTMDIILGPVYNSSLRVAATLAKQKHKLLISPFSASENITTQNSFYLSANPTLSRHCYEMLSFLDNNYHAKKIFMLYNQTSDDTATVRILKNAAGNFKDLHIVPYTDKSNPTYSNIISKFSTTDTNLIIVPSMDEDFTGIITKELYDYSDSVPLVVFGMPTWSDFETVRLDYLTAIHCMITAAGWCDKNSRAWKKFEKDFIATYHTRPLERNVTGYDQMMLAARLLTADTSVSGKNILSVSYMGLGQNFNFIPYYNTTGHSGNPDFIENANVHVLQFKDNSIVKRF
jgi:ABC-type branched-subunit amino acid transport system substrate-binding protein